MSTGALTAYSMASAPWPPLTLVRRFVRLVFVQRHKRSYCELIVVRIAAEAQSCQVVINQEGIFTLSTAQRGVKTNTIAKEAAISEGRIEPVFFWQPGVSITW